MKVLHRILCIATVATLLAGQAAGAVIIQDETDFLSDGTTPRVVWSGGSIFRHPSPGNEAAATNEPEGGDDGYHYSTLSSGVNYTWTPELTGQYVVSASWGAHDAHAPAVDFRFDSDGYETGGGDVLAKSGVDFRLKGDQTTTVGTVGTWSGYNPDNISAPFFFELGTFDLTPDSQFRASAASGTLTAAVWSFTAIPEPSSIGLMIIGLAIAGGFCRRRA